MGILSPSVEVDSQGWASPLILGGPTSPSGSGEGFLFLAVLETAKRQEWGGGWRGNKQKCTQRDISHLQKHT